MYRLQASGFRLRVAVAWGLALGFAWPLAGQERDPLQLARRHVAAGDRLVAGGDVLAGCREYRLAAAVAPEWWEAAVRLAECARQAGDFRTAIFLLRRAASTRDDLYPVHLALARVLAEAGRASDAETEYRRAAALGPERVEPRLELARLLRGEKESARALVAAKEALQVAAGDVRVRRLLAELCEETGDLAAAEEHRRFLAVSGADPRRDLAELAGFYARHGEGEAAARVTEVLRRGGGAGEAAGLPEKIFAGRGNHSE